jgi:hypothetical protein
VFLITRIHGDLQGNAVAARPLPDEDQRIVQRGGQMELTELELKPSSLHLGEIQEPKHAVSFELECRGSPWSARPRPRRGSPSR